MDDVNGILKKVQNKYIEILYYVSEYKIIFVDDKEMENVIEQIDSRFFYDLYWLYWNFITIRICAIMERKETMSKKNLSIPLLISIAENKKLNCLKNLIIKKDNIEKKLKPFKDARNKAFGHYDLKSNIEKSVFERLELDNLKIICSEIEDILNLIELELGGTQTLYGARISHGALKVNKVLKLGIKKRNELKK
ncbi:hypothetical protein [Olleya sp. AS48]|uniref:AbiU2 domain-containing protein n=1 Tax=Olleya sp. AS48 TaxID=3135774 RepID=UPI0031778FDB